MPDFITLLVAEPALVVAYAVFGIVGFGSTLVAAPLLAHVLPLSTIVPAIAVTDMVASWSRGKGFSAHVSGAELKRLVPPLLIGTVFGTWLLLSVPARQLMLALGVFVVLYAANGLCARTAKPQLAPAWAWWFGAAGGVLSAMFGAGGWVYSAYLMRRLNDPLEIRATQNAVLTITSFVRVGLFAVTGRYFDLSLWVLVLTVLPAIALGLLIGHRIALHMNRQRFLQALYTMLLVTGSSLVWRGLASD